MKRIIITVFLSVFAFIFINTNVNAQLITDQALKFGRALAIVDAFYVDSTDQETLTEKAIVEVLKSLDPHSVYISKEEVKEMNEGLEGNFEGIGIQFNILYDSIIVISPIPGGPSEEAGLRAGDRIVKIEGNNVAGIGITTTGVRKLLLGDKGTKVDVGIFRRGQNKILEYTIIRDKIPVNSLDAAYMLDNEVGYIKLNRFSATSENEFNMAVNDLINKDMNSLVLDLRGNTGGYLEAAIRLCDHFWAEEKLIVYLEGLKTPRQDLFTKSDGKLADSRIIVLVDEGSASASEILAGALQDWDRGIVVGRRTFGKGLVQNGFYLNDGSILRLTIARYYTPTGRLIQRPYDKGVEQYITDFYSRYSNGEMVSADSIQLPDSLKYYTLSKQRPVFGGGGIMPDLFIPADTSWYSDYYRDLIRKNVITEFTLDYVDRNRNELVSNYTDFEKFRIGFMFNKSEIKSFIDKGVEMGVDYKDEQFNISEKQLLKILKALVARDLWDMSEYYQVVNIDDPAVIGAYNVIKDHLKYEEILSSKQN